MKWLLNLFRKNDSYQNNESSNPIIRETSNDLKPIVTALSDEVFMDPGAPEPILLQSSGTAILVFRKANDSSTEELEENYAFVFDGVRQVKMGSPNDEALGGHPLSKFGLTWHTFHEVRFSPWIAELKERNKVHHRHNSSLFDGLKHFIITFKDETFEVVCASYRKDVFKGLSREQILQQKMKFIL